MDNINEWIMIMNKNNKIDIKLLKIMNSSNNQLWPSFTTRYVLFYFIVILYFIILFILWHGMINPQLRGSPDIPSLHHRGCVYGGVWGSGGGGGGRDTTATRSWGQGGTHPRRLPHVDPWQYPHTHLPHHYIPGNSHLPHHYIPGNTHLPHHYIPGNSHLPHHYISGNSHLTHHYIPGNTHQMCNVWLYLNNMWQLEGTILICRQGVLHYESTASVNGAISHADTLEIFCHSPTWVLLLALESMESKRHTSYQSHSMNVYIQNHWSTALKTTLNYCTNSNYALSRDAVNVI